MEKGWLLAATGESFMCGRVSISALHISERMCVLEKKMFTHRRHALYSSGMHAATGISLAMGIPGCHPAHLPCLLMSIC